MIIPNSFLSRYLWTPKNDQDHDGSRRYALIFRNEWPTIISIDMGFIIPNYQTFDQDSNPPSYRPLRLSITRILPNFHQNHPLPQEHFCRRISDISPPYQQVAWQNPSHRFFRTSTPQMHRSRSFQIETRHSTTHFWNYNPHVEDHTAWLVPWDVGRVSWRAGHWNERQCNRSLTVFPCDFQKYLGQKLRICFLVSPFLVTRKTSDVEKCSIFRGVVKTRRASAWMSTDNTFAHLKSYIVFKSSGVSEVVIWVSSFQLRSFNRFAVENI